MVASSAVVAEAQVEEARRGDLGRRRSASRRGPSAASSVSSAASACAMASGAIRYGRASFIARLLAKSPCAGSAGRSISTGGRATSAGHVGQRARRDRPIPRARDGRPHLAADRGRRDGSGRFAHRHGADGSGPVRCDVATEVRRIGTAAGTAGWLGRFLLRRRGRRLRTPGPPDDTQRIPCEQPGRRETEDRAKDRADPDEVRDHGTGIPARVEPQDGGEDALLHRRTMAPDSYAARSPGGTATCHLDVRRRGAMMHRVRAQRWARGWSRAVRTSRPAM